MKLPELKALMKEHKIKGLSTMNKPEMIACLIEHGILSQEHLKKKVEKREVDPKFAYLKSIRNNPQRVLIRNVETGETIEYPSIYKATRSIKSCPKVITANDGKVWKNKYEIKIIREKRTS